MNAQRRAWLDERNAAVWRLRQRFPNGEVARMAGVSGPRVFQIFASYGRRRRRKGRAAETDAANASADIRDLSKLPLCRLAIDRLAEN